MVMSTTNNSIALKRIIKDLRSSSLDESKIIESTKELEKIGYKYNSDKFPELINTKDFVCASADSPTNLAEALIWKLGRWKIYQDFIKNYHDEKTEPEKTNVVLYAFAKHLKNPDETPIYDQHVIRALWAIDTSLSDEEDKLKSLLIGKNDKWKDNASGEFAIERYCLYLDRLQKIKKESQGVILKDIDRLLMPLGQAIKKEIESYNDFIKIRDK